MLDYSLKFEGVGKCYSLYDNPAARMWDNLLGRTPNTRQFWALQHANFTIKPGEVVGLVGKNGAGKSTLLQLACGTLQPSVGSIHKQGRIAALLELGAGFNPEFTGRQNILLNAPLFGLSHDEVKSRIDSIIEFADIGRFVDLPVRTYSSGMFVRLAFSLATAVEPQILIVDEALSVGDGEFARRSFDRIMSLKDKGATVLFCSHSPFQVESLCERALWVDQGRIRMDGLARDVVAAYNDFLDSETERLAKPGAVGIGGEQQAVSADEAALEVTEAALPEVTTFFSPGHASGRFTKVTASCDGVPGRDLQVVSGQSDLAVDFEFEVSPNVPAPNLAVSIHQPNGRIVASAGTWVDGFEVRIGGTSINGLIKGEARIEFPKLPLLKGQYTLTSYLFCERGLMIYSSGDHFARLNVTQDHVEQGIVRLPHQWGYDIPTYAVPAAPSPLSVETPAGRGEVKCGPFQPRHFEGVRALFELCFERPFDTRVWEWKYQWSVGYPGMVAERDGLVIGFFGGMLRPMEQGSLRVQGLQVGDVMVHPKERGAFTRKGIFYQITHPYLAEHIVEADETRLPSGPKAVLGFGFPTIRHMILGEKLKFYKPSGAKIMQLVWAAEAAPRNPWWTVRRTEHDVSVADRLYSEMKASLPQYLIPVRNAQWVNARFVNHPTHHYVIFALRHRMTQRVAALMVVRERADHLEWIDFVGGREHIDLCLTSLRRHAHALGKAKVQTWLSSWVSDVFNLQSPVVEDTGIVVPTNSHPESAFSEELSSRLWLMTGDTDFR